MTPTERARAGIPAISAIQASLGTLAVLTAALAVPASARALPNPNNPSVALFERTPGGPIPPSPVSSTFPELTQDANGYWLIDFGHLASFPCTVATPVAQPPPSQTPVHGTFGQPSSAVLSSPASAGAAAAVGPAPAGQPDASAQPTPPEIPANVRALDGRRVCVSGFMLPISLDDQGLTREFLIIRSPLVCCFGIAPAPNEWVVVRMTGKAATPIQDVPLKFYGTLHVGAQYESGVFTGLYRLDGEKVESAY